MNDDATIAQQYTKKMQVIEESILNLLEEEEPQPKDYDKINELINNTKTEFKQQDSRQILYLLINIAENHYKTPGFFDRIFTLIKLILQDLGNFDLFNVFKDHKLLLLYLFQNKIIQPTKHIKDIIYDNQYEENKYDYYFFPEFRHFFEKEGYYSTYHEKREHFFNSEEKFEEKRKSGENDSYICQLIRNDSIKEFIIYINKNNINFSSQINESVFETNPLLLTKKPSLIEYAAFYGSIQIFQYLLINKAEITSELSIYAIHGRNESIIQLLEENQIKFYRWPCLMESIKCHHNEIANYIKNQMEENEINKSLFFSCLQYHNFVELFELIEKIGFYSFKKSETFKKFIEYDHTFFTKFYITCHNNPITKDKKYYTNINKIIEMVINNGNVELLDLFVNDFDVNKKIFNHESETVLHLAVKCRKYDIVKYLFDKKLNVNVNELLYGGDTVGYDHYEYHNGEKNALHIAIQNEDVKIVDLLLKNDKINANAKLIKEDVDNGGINSDIKELTPLYMAVEAQNYEIVRLLLSNKDIDVNARSLNVFYYNYNTRRGMCAWGRRPSNDARMRKRRMKSMREEEYDDDDDDEEFNHRRYSGDDDDDNDDDCTYVEANTRDQEITRMYRSGGVFTPLFAAIESQDIQMIKILLSHPKIDVNARSISYSPYKKSVVVPLYRAVELKNDEIQQLLMSTGKVDEQKMSSFYEEERRLKLENERFFLLKCEKLPFESHSSEG